MKLLHETYHVKNYLSAQVVNNHIFILFNSTTYPYRKFPILG